MINIENVELKGSLAVSNTKPANDVCNYHNFFLNKLDNEKRDSNIDLQKVAAIFHSTSVYTN